MSLINTRLELVSALGEAGFSDNDKLRAGRNSSGDYIIYRSGDSKNFRQWKYYRTEQK